MRTNNALAPLSHAGRTPYPFGPSLYQLCVQKVKVQPAPGAKKIRRILRIIFAVHTRGLDGSLVRCPPGQDCFDAYVILGLEDDGTWKPLDGDDALLEALDAPKSLNRDDDVAEILSGRWIEGRPGPADPEGFNSLVDYRSLDPPPLGTPAGSPPAATLGPAPERAETRGRTTPADEGTDPQKPPASDPLLSLDDPTFSLTWRGKTCFLGNNGSFKLLKLLESRRGEFIEDREIGEKCCRNEDLAEGPAIRQVKVRLIKCLRSNEMRDLAAAIKRQLGHYGLIL